MTVSLCGHDTSNYTGNRVWRRMFSSDSRRREVTEQMWYAAEDCSQAVQQRLEKLSRRLAVGWESGTGNRQFTRRSRKQTPSKLRLCWMMWSLSARHDGPRPWRHVNQHSQLVIYPYQSLVSSRRPSDQTHSSATEKSHLTSEDIRASELSSLLPRQATAGKVYFWSPLFVAM